MTTLAKRPHTVGNKKRYTVNYGRWLPEGVTIASSSVTTTDTSVTITVAASADHRLTFFVEGGTLNQTFTVSVQITDSIGQIKNDTIEFSVVSA